MRPRRLPVALLLGALLAPLAEAGSERDPEIRDPEDRPEWSPTDLLAAWFEAEEAGVRFSVRTLDGSMPERYPDHVYWVSFRVENRSVGAAVGFGNDGVMRGHLGPLDGPAWLRGGFERVANGGVVDLRSERGRPSTWSGLIPWGAVAGLEPGAVLDGLAAGTAYYHRDQRRWEGGLDVAGADRPFVAVIPRPLLPILVPAWVIPTLVVGTTLAGAGAGLLLARRPRPAPPPAPAAPPAPRAPPPGQRFRRDPRQ